MKRIFLFLSFAVLWSCGENEKLRFQIQGGDGFLQSGPVSFESSSLGNKTSNTSILLQNGKPVPFQIHDGRIWFIHEPQHGGWYEIGEAAGGKVDAAKFSAEKNAGNMQLLADHKPLVTYRFEMAYPPIGVDSIFKKSGYIHPIITPYGDTLTRIQPPDHYHHYGLWGPWTHTRIDTTRVDFWNLREGQGTVLFKKFNSTLNGQVSAGFTALQEHVDLKTENSPQVALEENLEVRLWDLNRDDRYMLDYTSTFSSPLANGILFEAYRYGGGLGMRFTERWQSDNCKVLTSEGKDRLEADGSNARWAIVSGAASDGNGTNGILFMSFPENRMHPEPMRVWPIDGNGGRGDMFFQFCPIRHEPWQISPNEEYQLKYRMVVFEGALSAQEAEAYWQAFARPLTVKRIL